MPGASRCPAANRPRAERKARPGRRCLDGNKKSGLQRAAPFTRSRRETANRSPFTLNIDRLLSAPAAAPWFTPAGRWIRPGLRQALAPGARQGTLAVVRAEFAGGKFRRSATENGGTKVWVSWLNRLHRSWAARARRRIRSRRWAATGSGRLLGTVGRRHGSASNGAATGKAGLGQVPRQGILCAHGADGMMSFSEKAARPRGTSSLVDLRSRQGRQELPDRPVPRVVGAPASGMAKACWRHGPRVMKAVTRQSRRQGTFVR